MNDDRRLTKAELDQVASRHPPSSDVGDIIRELREYRKLKASPEKLAAEKITHSGLLWVLFSKEGRTLSAEERVRLARIYVAEYIIQLRMGEVRENAKKERDALS
jgi:hypothetical protein